MCEGGIGKSVPMITEACRVMTNSDSEGQVMPSDEVYFSNCFEVCRIPYDPLYHQQKIKNSVILQEMVTFHFASGNVSNVHA